MGGDGGSGGTPSTSELSERAGAAAAAGVRVKVDGGRTEERGMKEAAWAESDFVETRQGAEAEKDGRGGVSESKRGTRSGMSVSESESEQDPEVCTLGLETGTGTRDKAVFTREGLDCFNSPILFFRVKVRVGLWVLSTREH